MGLCFPVKFNNKKFARGPFINIDNLNKKSTLSGEEISISIYQVFILLYFKEYITK